MPDPLPFDELFPRGYWILDDAHELVPVDLLTWGRWAQTHDRHVGLDQLEGYAVSTVFVGMPLGFGPGPPRLFETMVFNATDMHDSTLDHFTRRYRTWYEALAGHDQTVEEVRTWLAAPHPTPGET